MNIHVILVLVGEKQPQRKEKGRRQEKSLVQLKRRILKL